MTEFFASTKTFTIVLCILFHFANAFICSNTVLLCCFRLICLQNITFVEDHFDERILRICLSSFACAISVNACVLLIVNADIKTGTAFSMFTKQAIKDGKLSVTTPTKINNSLLNDILITGLFRYSYLGFQSGN